MENLLAPHASVLKKLNGKARLLKPAHLIDDTQKQVLVREHFKAIMETLGLDLTDDSLRDTPNRVAKMFVHEIFKGLNPKNEPAVTLFENHKRNHEMVIVRNISVHSFCEHHFLPFFGKAHIAYYPGKYLAGLSKLNRLVDFYARRPQLQERLTNQVADAIKEKLQVADVAVMIEAKHMCVATRGAQDDSSDTKTFSFSGKFRDYNERQEFLQMIK